MPTTALVVDSQGNLYGTTGIGGDHGCYDSRGCGMLFKLSPTGVEERLHTFCAKSGCTDGYGPGGLIWDSQGNLYGVTWGGGAYGYGTVFKLTP